MSAAVEPTVLTRSRQYRSRRPSALHGASISLDTNGEGKAVLFSSQAQILCGQCAVVLGWRPAEFWGATPAELACVLSAYIPGNEAPPDAADLRKLMEMYPDG